MTLGGALELARLERDGGPLCAHGAAQQTAALARIAAHLMGGGHQGNRDCAGEEDGGVMR